MTTPTQHDIPAQTPNRRRIVNQRLLAVTAAVCLVAILAGYGWYRRQANATSRAFLTRAESLEKEGDFSQAAKYYQRYIAVAPDDPEGWVRLVDALGKNVRTVEQRQRLSQLLYQTVGRVPNRPDLQKQLAENLFRTGQWGEAIAEAKKIPDDDPEGLKAKRWILAMANFAKARFEDKASLQPTLQELIAAAQGTPEHVELIEVTASAIRENPTLVPTMEVSPATYADQLIDRLLEKNPDSVEAHLARYRYRTNYRLPGAEADIAFVLSKEPDNVEALLASVAPSDDEAKDSSPANTKEREATLRRIIQLAPADPRAYILLAAFLENANRPEEVLTLLQQGREATEDAFDLVLAMAHSQISANRLEQATESLSVLDKQRARFIAQLDSAARIVMENRLRIVRARLDAAQEKPREAISKLAAAIVSMEGDPAAKASAEWMQAVGLLASLHARLNEPDKAGEYLVQLANLKPTDATVVEPAVNAMLFRGDYAAAINRLDDFVQTNKLSPTMAVQRLRAHLGAQLARPVASRNWTEFETALADAKNIASERPEVLFAELDYLLSQNQSRAIIAERLRSAEKSFESNPDFWRNAAVYYQRLDEVPDRDRALVQHARLVASPVDHAKLQSRVLAAGGEFEAADEALAKLESSLAAAEKKEIVRLRIETFLAAGKIAAALEKAKTWVDEKSTDPEALALGIEVALTADDISLAERLERQLVATTANGPEARYYQCRRLLVGFADLSKDAREELARSVAQLRADRPQWYPAAAVAGRLAQLQEDLPQAIAAFQAAVDLGDPRPTTLQQLALLLFSAGRANDAQLVLSRLTSEFGGNPAVDALAIDVAIRQNRLALALELARKGLEQAPQDPVRHLYLAELLAPNGQRDEALQLLRNATQQFPTDMRLWSALIRTLIQAGQASEGAAVIETIAKNAKLPEAERFRVAAEGFQLLGDIPKALQQYEAALAQDVSSVPLRLAYARLLLDNNPSLAREQLERVIRLDPRNREARRMFAVLLAASGREEEWSRAVELLETDRGAQAADAATNDRLRALLLSRKGRTKDERLANSQAARKILAQRQVSDGGESRQLNQQLMGQLFEQEALLSRDLALLESAREAYRASAEEGTASAERTSQFVDFLLRYTLTTTSNSSASGTQATLDIGEKKAEYLSEAEAQLEKLKRIQGGPSSGMGALVTALSARFRKAQGDASGAVSLINDYVQREEAAETDANRKVQRALEFGRLFSSIDAHAEAESWYRRFTEGNPNAYVLVVQSLVAQGKRRAAADYCLERCNGSPDPSMTQVLVELISLAPQEEKDSLADLRPIIKEALQRHADKAGILQATAVLQASTGEYAEAIASFRRIVEANPQNPVALNNLATLLAEQPNQLSEALKTIEQAIASAGRLPYLLDTLGTIYAKVGDFSNAVATLEEAISAGVQDARYYLHLAAAYNGAGRRGDAGTALATARSLGLGNFVLTPDDRAMESSLNQALQSSQ